MLKADPEDGKGALLAWDPVHRKHAGECAGHALEWRHPLDRRRSGVPGYWRRLSLGLRCRHGARLWRSTPASGIIAPPISYSAGGKQYVAVLVGYGGSASIGSNLMHVGWKWGAPRWLLSFTLDGKVVLPESSPRDPTVHALHDSTLQLSDTDIQAGKSLFLNCMVCHGRDAYPRVRPRRIFANPRSRSTLEISGPSCMTGPCFNVACLGSRCSAMHK